MVQNQGNEGGMEVLPPDIVLDGDVCLLLLIFMVYITDPPVAGPGTQGRFPYKVQQLESHTTPLQKVMKLFYTLTPCFLGPSGMFCTAP